MTDGFYWTLGRNIRDARKEVGLTQHGLARRLGMSRASVANAEVGRQRTPLHRLAHIAEVCGVELRDLMPDQHQRLPTGDDVLGRMMQIGHSRRAND